MTQQQQERESSEMEQLTTLEAEESSPPVISATHLDVVEDHVSKGGREEETEEYDGSDDDFEFSFAPFDPEITDADGRIRTVYPVFNRDVFAAHPDAGGVDFPRFEKLRIDAEGDGRIPSTASCSSSESDDLEGTVAEGFRLRMAAPPSPKKSNSTGRLTRSWKIRDVVVGRSHSDGKEKLDYLPTASHPSASGEEREKGSGLRPRKAGEEEVAARRKVVSGRKGKGGEMDLLTAHRLYYAKGGPQDRRQTYLPYRKDIVGFFGGASASSRSGFNPF